MLEHQRQTLRENAQALANLLTENVPYLLTHYLQNGVLSEAERESIISADSAPAIRVKLFETLANKDELTLDAVLDGLSATDNHSVIAEINTLLPTGKQDDSFRINDDGSGDKFEDVSTYATSLVDDVIAKAEETTAQIMKEKDAEENEDKAVESETEEIETKAEESLIQANVEVHITSPDEKEVPEEPAVKEEEDDEEPPKERHISVSFAPVTTVIEDDKDEDELSEPPSSPSTQSPPPLTPSEKYPSHTLGQQSDNEEDDNIDIEKEFAMPPEATEANSTTISSSSVTNGGPTLTRMSSNEIILEEEGKNNNTEKDELDAILAKKALVRQQVEKFEKTSPSPPPSGKIKYSFRTASQEKTEIKEEERGSNVKNLKNFFQQLSANSDKKTPPSGPVKPVGKLKVTFPSS